MYPSDPSFTLLLAARAGPSLRGNSMTTRELKTHDSNQEKNDFMATTPEADSSAVRPCPGKLSKGPACSVASGWGLSCEGFALHQARPEGQVAECGTTGICHNPARPAPAPRSAFMNGSTSQTVDWLSRWLRDPIIISRCLVSAWGLSSSAAVNGGEPFPQEEERGRGVIFIFIFKFHALFLRRGIVSF